MFPSEPRKIRRGDHFVLYAARHRVILATGEALSNPYKPASGTSPRYPWIVDVVWDEETTIPFVRFGVSLGTIGVDGKSVRQQSHIRLSDEQYRAAVRVLKQAKAKLAEGRAPRTAMPLGSALASK